MKTLSAIIVDDEKGPRERLAVLLSKIEEVKILGIEENPDLAIESIINKKPDIVFVDVEMPRLSGFDVIKAVRKALPNQVFIFITGYNQYAIKAIKIEAFDFLIKPVDIDELRETVQRYQKKLNSNHWQVPNANQEILNCLTKRELQILSLIGEHKTASEIAEELNISKHTVDTHRNNILEKVGLHKTSELAVFARENGL